MKNAMPYLDKFTQWANDPAHANLMKNLLLIVGAVAGLVAGLVSLGFIVGKIQLAWTAISATFVWLSTFWTATLLPALGAL